MHVMRVALHSALIQMRLSFARSTFKFAMLIHPLVYATISYMILRRSQVTDYLSYVIIGTSITSFWTIMLFSSATDIDRERSYGTLELVLYSPTDYRVVLAGKAIGNVSTGLGSVALIVAFGWLSSGTPLVVHSPGAFILAAVMSVIGFLQLSLVLAGLLTLSRKAVHFMNSLSAPVFFLSGVMYPLSMVPTWLRPISYLLPTTWMMKGLEASQKGRPAGTPLMILGLMLLVYGLLAFGLFKKLDHRTRMSGEAGWY